MADAILEFDPVSEGAANSPLLVWNTASYAVTAFDPDAAQQTVQWASSVDTEGGLPASAKDENRTISLTIECLSAAALRALQAKVTKISREQGTLKYTLPNSEVVIFDLLARESFKPQFDVKYFINSGAYCTVDLSFTAKPYGRGPLVTATLNGGSGTGNTITATNTKAPFVFTTTAIKGDIPARGFLKIGNVTNLKTAAIWGIESRYYNASTSLLLESESGNASFAVLNAGSTGASGAGANKVMRHLDVGTVGVESYVVRETSGATQHTGTFRVFARVQALSTNTGIVSTQLWWKPNVFQNNYVALDWVPIQTAAGVAIKGSWVVVDLGLVTIPPAVRNVGNRSWLASLYSKSTVGTDDIDYDWIALVPAEEGSGRLEEPISGIDSSGSAGVEFAYDVADIVTFGGFYYEPSSYEGDMLTIPPAGAEARTTRFIVFLTGGAGGNLTDTVIDAANFDAISATLTYQPRYLVVPEP